MTPHANSQINEGERLFGAVFKKPAPTRVLERYVKAVSLIEAPFSAEERESSRRLIKDAMDIEAVEFVSRLKKKNLLLCNKFRLIVSISECEPELRHHFVNNLDRRWTGFYFLVRAVFRAVYKFVVGTIGLRHG